MHARATTQHIPGEGQRTGLRTTTAPYLARTPPQAALLSGFHLCILYYYLYLFCFIMFHLTPGLVRFVKLFFSLQFANKARM